MLHSSLALARTASSCPEGLHRTRTNLHDVHGGDEDVLFPLTAVLERSGLDDAVWALRAVPPPERVAAERLGRTFAADCVERVAAALRLKGAEEEFVARSTALARRAAAGEAGPTELARLWRSAHLPTRAGRSGWVLRAARACVFPGGVSEAARHSAACAVRATAAAEGGARDWQAARLRERLLGLGRPNPVPPAAVG